jgi:hypothetical protein
VQRTLEIHLIKVGKKGSTNPLQMKGKTTVPMSFRYEYENDNIGKQKLYGVFLTTSQSTNNTVRCLDFNNGIWSVY